MMENIRQVEQAMLQKLAASALDKKDAVKLGFKPLLASNLPPKLTEAPAAGFVLPYFEMSGATTNFYRFRYLEEPARRGFDALVAHKAAKYIQPAGLKPRVYFSRLCDWKEFFARSAAERPLIITEGELKASCAVKHGIPCIGLGGVWNFKSKENSLIDDLKKLPWADTITYIVYDSDARSNYQVLMAENALAKELLALGASIVVVRLPELVEGFKTGVDDFIVAKGADEFLNLCEATPPWDQSTILHELNEQVVFVHDPGMVLELKSLQRMAPNSFANSIYANKVWEEKIVSKNTVKIVKRLAAQEWLKWPARAEVKRTTYMPGVSRITTKGELNTWPGWGMNGDTVQAGDTSLWRQLLAFLFYGESKAHTKWFEQWLAYPLQNPGVKLFSAVVMWGGIHGTGKSLIGYTMERIYGKNFAEIADRDLLSGFNEWAEGRQFVMGDEITGGDKRASGDRMKGLITQRFLRVNAKYVATYVVPDCINYYFTSNHPDSFFVEDSDRRYFIHEVKSQQPLPDAFYKDYDVWYKSDAVGALFYYLLNLDMRGFNPSSRPPETNSKRDMISLGRSDIGQWVASLKEDPDSILRMGEHVLSWSLATTVELHTLYDPGKTSRVSQNGMARELRRAGFRKVFGGENIWIDGVGNQRFWAVRNLEQVHAITPKSKIVDLYFLERQPVVKKEKF